ncbi:hypothetical protein ABID22_001507 [Pontibacter aydingkolensis]|uniref:Uncharacterized protein n=1 Tax=Pontibacter aydingkolensis TaxID=1911536 RepID=A0ABS7CTK3_9BACT|nr:hypothetical protein [Pontibacter aydingkolensis]MBW7467181.1 hypothetical protein [Pontibacter aydingkolensis]
MVDIKNYNQWGTIISCANASVLTFQAKFSAFNAALPDRFDIFGRLMELFTIRMTGYDSTKNNKAGL